MTSKATQEELQAASYANLRAHATSDEANALVGKLAAMVEEHSLKTGLRKNRRKDTAEKLEYTQLIVGTSSHCLQSSRAGPR
jgi:hypothetical protein